MLMSEALLVILILLPAVLAYLLKSNAAMAFLALCGGFAAITLSGSDIEHLFGKTKITSLTSNDVDLILLGVPLLLTLIFTFRSVTAKNLRWLQVIPALCAGALFAVIAAPMLNSALNTNYSGLSVWKDLQNVQSYIVGAGLLISLLVIWFSGFLHSKSSGKHSKKHK